MSNQTPWEDETPVWEARTEAGFTRGAMRAAVSGVRRAQREMQEQPQRWVVLPGEGLLADMLEQVLDETEVAAME